MLKSLLQRIGNTLSLTYVVLDGAFGTNYALQMVRRCGMHLISKLQCNSALYFQYAGPYGGRGPRRKYGKKIEYAKLPQQYLKHSSTDHAIRTEIYQMPMLHKLFPHVLNIVLGFIFFYLIRIIFIIELVGYYGAILSFFTAFSLINDLGLQLAYLKFFSEAKNPEEEAVYNGTFLTFRIFCILGLNFTSSSHKRTPFFKISS